MCFVFFLFLCCQLFIFSCRIMLRFGWCQSIFVLVLEGVGLGLDSAPRILYPSGSISGCFWHLSLRHQILMPCLSAKWLIVSRKLSEEMQIHLQWNRKGIFYFWGKYCWIWQKQQSDGSGLCQLPIASVSKKFKF